MLRRITPARTIPLRREPQRHIMFSTTEDLKVGKLTSGDLGQLQLYVNYYDREMRTAGDAPTLGLILCTDKNDAAVQYTLGAEQEKTIFASRYKLHVPTEAQLKAEVRRELKQLSTPGKSGQ